MTLMKKLKKEIMAASGEKKAKLVLKHAKIINVFTESIEEGDIAVEAGHIVGIGSYEGEKEIDLKGRYVCSGLIDGHIHLESSMVLPEEFQRAVLPHGTTAVITDPHEIANVAGIPGIQYMMKSAEGLMMDVYFMMPSCVPASRLDESGAVLRASDLNPFYSRKRVRGLAEMMDSAGIVGCEEGYLEKLEEAASRSKIIDGHAPFLSGKALNAYITAGIRSDHECSNFEEAREKLARGQWIMIREGTAAKNLEQLMGLFDAPYYQRAMLVTDDKHPGDLLRGGHIDGIIRMAVKRGADPIRAIKMGSYHPALYFGLTGKGAVAPGYEADLVVFDDLENMKIWQVYKAGKLAAENGACTEAVLKKKKTLVWSRQVEERVFHSFHLKPIQPEDLKLEPEPEKLKSGPEGLESEPEKLKSEPGACAQEMERADRRIYQRVIDLVEKELITKERITEWKNVEGFAPGVDISRNIVKLAALERHHGTGHIGLGFLGNYGLRKGAVATSIGHDSHNLVIAGTNDADMALAGNRVIENEGGLAVAVDGVVLADLPLPVAGLMAELPLEEVDRRLEEMKAMLEQLGVPKEIDAFMTLAFVSLPVIPKLRLNTYGIIDVAEQKIVKPFDS
ncbi:MAG: adenine deaminase [Lachnospiraceae bacterium]|nr:adenine deaminase [Lachnospiraceae bacterium]